MFKTEKVNLEKIRTGLQQDHVLFKSSLTPQITKLQDDLAMESKVMDALDINTENVKVLDLKLQQSEKQGVSPQSSDPKQRGEGGSNVEPPKVPIKPIIKKEPKGKENLIEDEPIIDDNEDEEPDEAELKRRKARDAELNETQRIV
ncbi:unnamed protein product [Lactuca saligna]|uniref:Uncharacterized protein n=1 Tax=Lactuca saligna TaxID=75948 RepID=A0AA35YEY1_LACSI|nr:unnamed protein product [Lactuca saligna]